MSRASVLARGRAFAVGGFVDTCVIRRVVLQSTNPLDASVVNTKETVYSGVCRVQLSPTSPSGGRVGSGADDIVVYGATLQLPVLASAGVRRGDEVTMTACATDADLVGRVLFVETLGTKTHATARRLGLVEAT